MPRVRQLDIIKYDFIVGPHLINENHWIAVIIDVKKKLFLSIDPQKYKSDLFDIYIDSWLHYYESRYSKNASWRTMTIDHPIQTDGCNCGVFVMLFIEHYITKGKIGFETNNMYDHRLKIAEKLKQFI